MVSTIGTMNGGLTLHINEEAGENMKKIREKVSNKNFPPPTPEINQMQAYTRFVLRS
jgi:hypothetical protein